MDEPPVRMAPQPTKDGPANFMLVDKEWRPADGRDIPELLECLVHDLGAPVSEDTAPTRHFRHEDPAGEDCAFKVDFANGEYLQHNGSSGWEIGDQS